MLYLMAAWELVSQKKLANDLVLISQGYKNPIQVFLETNLNEYAKQFVYTSLNYNNR